MKFSRAQTYPLLHLPSWDNSPNCKQYVLIMISGCHADCNSVLRIMPLLYKITKLRCLILVLYQPQADGQSSKLLK